VVGTLRFAHLTESLLRNDGESFFDVTPSRQGTISHTCWPLSRRWRCP